MNFKLKPTNNVTNEPVSLATAQLHLKLDLVGSPPSHPDDALVLSMITAARQDAEKYTGLAVAYQTYQLALDAFPRHAIDLGIWPVSQVVSITYVDRAGVTQTLSAANYTLDTFARPSVIHPTVIWPDTKEMPNAVVVTFRAGFTDGQSPNSYPVPKAITQAMLLMIGHLYENREAVNVGSIVTTYPLGYLHLLTPHRLGMGL